MFKKVDRRTLSGGSASLHKQKAPEIRLLGDYPSSEAFFSDSDILLHNPIDTILCVKGFLMPGSRKTFPELGQQIAARFAEQQPHRPPTLLNWHVGLAQAVPLLYEVGPNGNDRADSHVRHLGRTIVCAEVLGALPGLASPLDLVSSTLGKQGGTLVAMVGIEKTFDFNPTQYFGNSSPSSPGHQTASVRALPLPASIDGGVWFAA